MVPLLRVMHAAIRARRPAIVRTLAAWLRAQPRPAAVVSVLPNFNGIIRDALDASHPGVPLVVVLTDFADFPPRFWIEPGLDHVVVATDEARAAGAGADRRALASALHRVSGMVLHPRFYRSAQTSTREQARAELGVAAGRARGDAALRRQGLAGDGAARHGPARARAARLRVIAVCGENPRLFARLAPLEARAAGRLLRFGFTERVAELLAASDLLVTKPGPGSLAEAFHQRVPVIVTRNRPHDPAGALQHRLRARRAGSAWWSGHWREIPAEVARLRADAGAAGGDPGRAGRPAREPRRLRGARGRRREAAGLVERPPGVTLSSRH